MNRTLFIGIVSAAAALSACANKEDAAVPAQAPVQQGQQQGQWQQPQQQQQGQWQQPQQQQQGQWQQPQQQQQGQWQQPQQQQAQQPAQQGWQQPQQQQQAPAAQQPAAQQPAVAMPATTNGASGSAQSVDANLAGAATQVLATLAKKNAPNSVAEGQPLAGNFQAGQTLEGNFNLQPGKCYSVVGASLGPGSQLDAQIVITTVLPGLQFGANSAKGKASPTGSEVVLGGTAAGSKCVSTASLLPLTAKYVVTMAKGTGMAAAQLFVK